MKKRQTPRGAEDDDVDDIYAQKDKFTITRNSFYGHLQANACPSEDLLAVSPKVLYDGHSINKLQNGAIPLILKIGKIQNILLVGNLIDEDVIIVTLSVQ